MKFSSADPTDDLVVRLVSETGRWQVGVYPVLFGFRVRAGLTGTCWYALDYCAADNEIFLMQLLIAVVTILESYPEDVTEQQISADFPRYQIKPIDRDPTCWARLQEMAKAAMAAKSC